ncbi:MAG: hypothetical protein HY328_07435 [Chloroflexi bacterium]|nr:hypothetical protein [Chloroflexota bacterium]
MIRQVWKKWRRASAALACLLALALIAAALLPAQPTAAASCQELMADGGFESGTGWQTVATGNYSLFSNFLVRSGAQAAHLAGVNSAADSATTSLTLPADHSIALSFWWQVHTEESAGGYDALSLLLTDSQGKPLYAVAGLTDLNATAVWQQTQVDLSAFAGQTVQLRLSATTDGSLVTDFFIDDLSVTACAATTTNRQIFLPLTSKNR